MLETFIIKNFKCYEDDYTFNFPGLTYLTGINNAGKSSVLQCLHLLSTANSNNNLTKYL